MARRRKPEEIVSKLRQVDVLVSQGKTVADSVRSIGVAQRRVMVFFWPTLANLSKFEHPAQPDRQCPHPTVLKYDNLENSESRCQCPTARSWRHARAKGRSRS